MKLSNKTRVVLVLLGDLAALYAALLVALFIRYGMNFNEEFVNHHATPFTFIFPIWLLVFYIAGLYDLPKLRNNIEFLKTFYLALFVSALLTAALFYLVPYFGIAPKTNLFIFIVVYALIEGWWRRTFNVRASFREGLNRVALLDTSKRAQEIYEAVRHNPQMGYDVKFWAVLDPAAERNGLKESMRAQRINLVVVPAHWKHDAAALRELYELLALGIEIRDLPTFYEMVFGKVPLDEINESWFIEHGIGQRRFYDDLKRGLELSGAALLGIALSPLLALIALIVRLTSPGPAIYSQTRIGKNNRPFTLYKFRTMRRDAERHGAQWAEKNDGRVTPFGKFLRYTHLDELPQLWNIVRGELSFVGPRPERPEFVQPLAKTVPYYGMRHLVKPGVAGWAQLNYRYGASVADAREKLQYDLYYLKNSSIVLDLAILVKTVRAFFVNQE